MKSLIHHEHIHHHYPPKVESSGHQRAQEARRPSRWAPLGSGIAGIALAVAVMLGAGARFGGADAAKVENGLAIAIAWQECAVSQGTTQVPPRIDLQVGNTDYRLIDTYPSYVQREALNVCAIDHLTQLFEGCVEGTGCEQFTEARDYYIAEQERVRAEIAKDNPGLPAGVVCLAGPVTWVCVDTKDPQQLRAHGLTAEEVQAALSFARAIR